MKGFVHLALAFFLITLCLLPLACSAAPASTTAASPATSITTSPASTVPTSTPPKTTESTPPVTKTEPPTTKPPVQTSTPTTTQTVIAEDFWQTCQSHFGFMPALWDYENARAAGAGYNRPFFELFQWGNIEKEPGQFDFYDTDKTVKETQAQGLHILANIQPFAGWDQQAGYGDSNHKGKPCDMDSYAGFLTKLVERYDGDSVDDMPGLTVPIKHWELMNEPEFQPMYFQGTPGDYVDTLKVTYETVKQADPEALIVQGGMAGMMEVCTTFWQGVFDEEGAQYLDIMNMHSIGHGEHLNIPAFQDFLEQNGLQDKPVWVTEVQFQQAQQTQNYSNADFAKILARSYIFALGNGVNKLFYVNIRMPPFYDAGIPFDEGSALITNNGEKSALFQAHLAVATMLGELGTGDTDAVSIIGERVTGWFVEVGQYKFTIQGKTIYALWGSGPLPAEITGQVRVTDITGAVRVTDATSLYLSDSPIFITLD